MTNGLTDEAIAAYAAQLLDLEADIEALQDDKKDVYANLREAYGKKAADSLKLAIKRHRMDADKREAADEIDAEAERFLAIIRNPSAPRAMRAREIIEEIPPHDADGVILETSSRAIDSVSSVAVDGSQPSLAGAEGEADRQPIQAETPTSGEAVVAAATGESPVIQGMRANAGGEDVEHRPVHVSEEPGLGSASVNAPAEGGTHSASNSNSAPVPPEQSVADSDRGGVVPPSLASVAHHDEAPL